MRMLEGDPVKPIAAGSPLQAALGKIVAMLVEAGAVAGQGSGVGGQESEERGGCVVAATTQVGPDRLGGTSDASAGQPAALVPPRPEPTSAPAAAATGAKVTKLPGYAMLDGCDPGVLETIALSGWLERFKDDGPLAREASLAASLARGNSGDFSADAEGSEVQSPRLPRVAVVAATTQLAAGGTAGDPLCYAAAAKHSQAPHEPAPRGIDVVGSPEWQVARAKWLKERDERVAAERLQKIRERQGRDEDRQRRAAAAARNRWLEAGQCQY